MTTACPRLPSAAAPLLLAAAAALVAGCASKPAAPTAPASTGSAGGGAAVGADATLQVCPGVVGTVRLQDENASAQTASSSGERGDSALESLRLLLRDVDGYSRRAGAKDHGGASIDSLRLLIQQSNCLAVVERGLGEAAATDEKRRANATGAQVRADADMGAGQEIAADFVLRSMVIGVNKDSSSSGFSLGTLVPWKGAGGASGGSSVSSADVQLVLFDVRTKLQLAVAHGHGEGSNTRLATSLLSRVGGAFGGGSYSSETKTSGATVLLQAYADAYNKLVPAMRNYQTQTVRGGLGAGGTLRVQRSGEAPAVKP